MIKVFVAEDEPFILKTIKSMIEDAHSRFKVVGEAFNGEQALAGIAEHKPDVLFTDIRMPFMDGLTLVSKLKDQGSDIIPVILSGYQDFEYARKALQLDVWDYLLKPLDNEALKAVLNDIYTRIHSKKITRQYAVLRNAIDHCTAVSNKETEEFTGLFGSNNLYYMLICSGSYCTFPCSWITPAKDFWFKHDLEYMAGKFLHPDDEYWVMGSVFENEKLLVLETVKGYEYVKSAFMQIHNELESKGFPITSVAGTSGQSLESLGFQIQKSQITLTKYIRFAKSQLLLEGEYDISNVDNDPSDINIEKTMNLLIQYGQSHKFKQEFRRLLALCEEKSIRQVRLERLMKHIMNLFFSEMSFLEQGKIVDTDLEINELISNSATYQAIYDGICMIFDDLFNRKKSTASMEDSNHKSLSDNIEKYIKSNYTKQITLQSLSDTFGLVPSYLSKIFKRYANISPIDYLINIRIEKAKELLLLEPPLILKEIAEAIGFNDQFYFSKVFKSVTGKSPSEFRLEKGESGR